MKIDVFSNGNLLYSITGTDDFDPSDIAIVSRNLIEKATMSAEGFDDLFFTQLKHSNTHSEAYSKAEEIHLSTFGHQKYSNFDCFRAVKSKRLNK